MKTITFAKVSFAFCLLLSACAQVAPQTASELGSTAQPANDQDSAEVATATEGPTAEPTPTVWPPVYEPNAIGDNRILDSFVLSITDNIVGGSSDGDHSDTVSYVSEPLSAAHIAHFSFAGSGGDLEKDSFYLLDGILFTKDGINGPPFNYYAQFLPFEEVDPMLGEAGAHVNHVLLDAADLRQGSFPIYLLESAEFVAQEEYQGIPANHFTFDESDLGGVGYIGDVQTAQGDVYLAQGENYLLYVHFTVTGTEASREFTAELTSINQLTEISLPADFPAFNLDPAVPFPEGSILWSVSADDIGEYDFYDNFVPLSISHDAFLDFYRNLPADSDWTLVEIAPTDEYYLCEARDCVTLTNGDVEVTLAPYMPGDFCVSTMPADYGCVLAFYKP
jgi:hypothetical protein